MHSNFQIRGKLHDLFARFATSKQLYVYKDIIWVINIHIILFIYRLEIV